MFWIYATLLIILTLWVLLPPLLKKSMIEEDDRRDQNIHIAKEQLAELETSFSNKQMGEDEYLSRRDELEQALYSDVAETSETTVNYAKPSYIGAVIVALLIPLISVGVYSQYGNSQAADPEMAKIAKKVPLTADGKPDIDAMVLGLRRKLDANPNNPEGWYMMGRSYMALKRYKGAVEAFGKLLELQPNDAKVMLFLADAEAMQNRGSMEGHPAELVEKSLSIEPNSITGLWLGGMVAQKQGKHSLAIKRWTSLIPLLDDDATQIAEIKGMIADSKRKLSAGTTVTAPQAITAPVAPTPPSLNDSAKSVAAQSIVVTVSLADKLKSQVKPTDSVFIYAKAMSGPPMPLAAKRIQVKDLPITVTLDDSLAMMPAMKLSAFPNVKIGARVSKSGNAIGANGDLYTEISSVKKGTKQTLVIDSILKK
ncbi:MAG: c-type cytochrome biogenesis protein CcmI [Aquificaceae bacterium]|nr:MAG: c-type cytochrome biogenesis protein CcmI [Aquificaceae bacterium]